MATVLTFVIILSLLVLVHELGHFFVAKILGIGVEEFGIGLPPKALTLFHRGRTAYTLNWLPVGGFVRLFGEDAEEQTPQTLEDGSAAHTSLQSRANNDVTVERGELAFRDRPNSVKAAVLLAGVMMNYLLGVVLIMVVFWSLGVPKVTSVIQVQEVAMNSPAEKAGIAKGDLIDRIAGQKVDDAEQVVQLIDQYLGRAMSLEITRGEQTPQTFSLTLTPRVSPPEGEGAIGIKLIVMPKVAYQAAPRWQVPMLAGKESVRLVGVMFVGIGQILRDLVTQGVVTQGVAGPIGIAKLTGEVAKEGLFPLLQFTALLSINLAVINIIPFPALDGGRLAFVVVESVLGREIAPRAQRWAHVVGMVILLLLMGLITFYDIVRVF